MTRTAQEASPTKEKLLEGAKRLILSKGFSATSVDDICRAAKVTKGSFFHYFESKGQLAKEVLRRFCADGAQMHGGFCGEETDPLKRVYKYIDGAIKMAKDPEMSQGCLLGLFAQELCDSNSEIREECCKGFDAWNKGFAAELAKAKAAYAPKAAFEPKALAEHLIAVIEGSMILGKARQDMNVLARNLEHYRAYLQSLFGR